jgi:small GTP-binding protein
METKKKIALLGDSAVGKTSLIRRFVDDYFEDAYITTIGSKVSKKVLTVPRPGGSTSLTLLIWDLLGRTGYAGFQARTFVGVDGAILVADVARSETLESLERYWIPSLLRIVDRVPLVLAVNKVDLTKGRAFDPESMGALTERLGMSASGATSPSRWFPTSAKSGKNVPAVFEALGRLLLEEERPPDPVRDLYESLVVVGTIRNADRTTAIGALDAILVDFSEQAHREFGDDRAAIVMLRQEVVRAGLDINAPDQEGVLRLAEYLAEIESEYLTLESARGNLERRLGWALGMRGER